MGYNAGCEIDEWDGNEFLADKMVASVDKYEFKLKVDEMKALVSARNYNAAAEIAETINWRKIRNLNALVLAGEVFEQVERYEESKEILLMAYDKSPIGRNIIYRLAEIAIKTKHFDEAQEYYDEFVDIAPHDNLKFVLKYKMTAAQGLSFKEQIQILEELKEQEYSEEWAYELAYLYHRDGQPEKCVEACDELILWFGDGIYVEKALELKMHYQPLTKLQEDKYRLFRQKRTGVIEVRPNDFLESGEIVNEIVEIPSVETNMGQYNTANLQEEIAKGIQQIASTDDENTSGPVEKIRQLAEDNSYLSMPEEKGQKAARIRKLVKMQETADIVLGDEKSKPEHSMSFEEIQAEWEKTKLAMKNVLKEAEERELEPAKEKTLEEAEMLMGRLLDIVSQIPSTGISDELEDQEHFQKTAVDEQYPPGLQNGLDQAGNIVASINKLLQEQIDSLIAEELKNQSFAAHKVSDPTRELPELPEKYIKSDQGMQAAVEKLKADDEENRDVKNMENQGAVSIMEKLIAEETARSAENPEMKKEISAIELLQRVRMESSAMNPVQKAAAEKQAADLNEKASMESSAVYSDRKEQLQQTMTTEKQDAEDQDRVLNGNPVRKNSGMVLEENPAMDFQSEDLSKNQVKDPMTAHMVSYAGENHLTGSLPMESVRQASAENSGMEFRQKISVIDPVMYIKERAAAGSSEKKYEERILAEESVMNLEQQNQRVPMDEIAVKSNNEYQTVSDFESEYAEGTSGFASAYSEKDTGYDSGYEGFKDDTDIWKTEQSLSDYDTKDTGQYINYKDKNRLSVEQKNKHHTEEISEEDMVLAAQAAGFYKEKQQTVIQDDMELKRLTPEQKNIFSYFVPVSGMEVQIYDLLQGVSDHLRFDKNALTGNIIVEGIEGNGKTVLIMDIIKVLQKEIKRPNGKIGKIDANALNQKDMDMLTEKVSGGCLIIESAGKITRETAVKLSRCMEKDHMGTLYILEDTVQGIQKALERDSSFAAKFTEKISIPLFSIDELAAFGRVYANDLNYDIDEMGILALYKRIGNIQKLDHVTTLTDVKEIVDEAIDNAEKGVFKKVFGILTATRANDDNYVILREKDFEE